MSASSGSERLYPAHMMANYVAGRCWIPGKRTPLRPRVLDPQDSWEDPVQPREVSRVSNCAGALQPLSSTTVHAGVRVPGGGFRNVIGRNNRFSVGRSCPGDDKERDTRRYITWKRGFKLQWR